MQAILKWIGKIKTLSSANRRVVFSPSTLSGRGDSNLLHAAMRQLIPAAKPPTSATTPSPQQI
jgi:hypothetical protein